MAVCVPGLEHLRQHVVFAAQGRVAEERSGSDAPSLAKYFLVATAAGIRVAVVAISIVLRIQMRVVANGRQTRHNSKARGFVANSFLGFRASKFFKIQLTLQREIKKRTWIIVLN